MRTRIDQLAISAKTADELNEMNKNILKFARPHLTGLTLSDEKVHLPLDVDCSPFDNSGTHKEGVEPTYKKGVAGYTPMLSYLGREGFCVLSELRNGSQHVQKETPSFLKNLFRQVKGVTRRNVLLRMDGGNDSMDNIAQCQEDGIDYLIKYNRRKRSLDELIEKGKRMGVHKEIRNGFDQYVFGEWHDVPKSGEKTRLVIIVCEKNIDHDGQILLMPEVTCEG
ncbi:transposase [Bacillus litorisediminis]|uniref:transposase n=1 Tax=Bacillus litorisediminis TaxID=2922713 RepID=UPI001FACE5E8|nr:transposase [Bacillus litorisediminis]